MSLFGKGRMISALCIGFTSGALHAQPAPADTAKPQPLAADSAAIKAPAEPAAAGTLAPAEAPAAAPKSDVVEAKVVVKGRRAVTPSNAQTIRDRDLKLRVVMAPTDLLKVTPGLYTGTHAGGGKANQYFIRGFDADHGTDLALWLDGMPINNVSHGHGQGYADVNFVIPELIDKVEVDKGPYNVNYGDFATGGAVRMVTRRNLAESEASASAGMFNTYRAFAMTQLNSTLKPVIAAEVYRADGPYKHPENLERYNLYMKTPLLDSKGTTLNFSMMGYGSGWNGSGQLPLREIEAGRISRWGSEDPSEGGQSQRYSGALDFASIPDRDQEWRASAYLIDYRLSLFSNFTFFAEDPANGDQINQRDERRVMGMNASYQRKGKLGSADVTSLLGVSTRNDAIRNNLDRARERSILGPKVDAEVLEGSLAAYFKESISPWPWLYAEAGLRGDYFGFEVNDKLAPYGDSSLTGVRDASIFSPKVNVVITPVKGTDVYLNYGEGFHSNDARGVVQRVDPARPLTKARGYEGGARTKLFDRLDLAGSLWYLEMDGELVWIGDGGGTEERGATERKGVDLELRYEILPWLWADFDMTKCSATYVHNAGNGNSVALAPELMMAGGLSWTHKSGFHGSLRGQFIDDRPATEDGSLTAEGFLIVDLGAGFRHDNVEISLEIANLFNTDWWQAQFANESRLPNEPDPVADMHVVPGTPFDLKGRITYYY